MIQKVITYLKSRGLRLTIKLSIILFSIYAALTCLFELASYPVYTIQSGQLIIFLDIWMTFGICLTLMIIDYREDKKNVQK
jgi:hypothetical protein